MRSVSTIVPAALLLFSVAPAVAGEQKPPPPTEERIRVANQHPFDVAACTQEVIELHGTPDRNTLGAALVLAQPRALECLTHDGARGEAPITEVLVTATVSDQGTTWAASGDNLTPSGAGCVSEVLKRVVKIDPLFAGAKPIELQGLMVHDGNVNAALEVGINAPSDWVASVRASMMNACSCYGAYASKRPPLLTADVKLAAGKSEVVFRKADTPEADALAQCLLPNFLIAPVPKSDREFRFAFKVVHLHTGDLSPAADLGPELAFQQAELGRLNLFARAELALVKRTQAGGAFDGAVAEYHKAPKASLFPALVTKCDALVAADDGWLAAANSLLAQEERMAASTKALAATDPSWQGAADAIAESFAATRKEVAAATQTLAQDKENCGKLK